MKSRLNSMFKLGQRATAMILNGLGFMDDRLYLFPKFLENKPVKKLFADDSLVADDFNDAALGRFLDAAHEYGETKLYSELALPIALEHKLLRKSIHLDTTSLSLQGEYKTEGDTLNNNCNQVFTLSDDSFLKDNNLAAGIYILAQNDPNIGYRCYQHVGGKYVLLDLAGRETEITQLENNSMHLHSTLAKIFKNYAMPSVDRLALNPDPKPKYGHSKNKRFDLKQMTLLLATTGAAGFPIWMESHSGNESD